jgi:hypothetical protein
MPTPCRYNFGKANESVEMFLPFSNHVLGHMNTMRAFFDRECHNVQVIWVIRSLSNLGVKFQNVLKLCMSYLMMVVGIEHFWRQISNFSFKSAMHG